jgi:hypothetical protein
MPLATGCELTDDATAIQYPDLPEWIQQYIDDGRKQADIPTELLNDRGIIIRSVPFLLFVDKGLIIS